MIITIPTLVAARFQLFRVIDRKPEVGDLITKRIFVTIWKVDRLDGSNVWATPTYTKDLGKIIFSDDQMPLTSHFRLDDFAHLSGRWKVLELLCNIH